MFASNSPDGPELYMADPSGASWVSVVIKQHPYNNMLLSIVKKGGHRDTDFISILLF